MFFKKVFDHQGNYKCRVEFLNGMIERPSDIYIDSEGFLYVTCYLRHCIKKFKFI